MVLKRPVLCCTVVNGCFRVDAVPELLDHFHYCRARNQLRDPKTNTWFISEGKFGVKFVRTARISTRHFCPQDVLVHVMHVIVLFAPRLFLFGIPFTHAMFVHSHDVPSRSAHAAGASVGAFIIDCLYAWRKEGPDLT